MKKIYNIAFAMVLATLTMVSCKKESLTFDGPVLAHFSTQSGVYFVDEAEDVFVIPVGITKPNDADITLTINIVEESTGLEGEDFTIESKQLTIKAGEVVTDLTVKGIFENLEEAKKVVFEIESSDKNAQFNQTYTMTIQRFCPFVRDDFIGTYLFDSAWWLEGDDPYEVEAVADPDDENAILVKDMYAGGFDIKIIFNATDKSNFTVSVPKQGAWLYGPDEVSLLGGVGKFSACDKTIYYETKHAFSGGTFLDTDQTTLTKLD